VNVAVLLGDLGGVDLARDELVALGEFGFTLAGLGDLGRAISLVIDQGLDLPLFSQ
jgi:hypothetical protein